MSIEDGCVVFPDCLEERDVAARHAAGIANKTRRHRCLSLPALTVMASSMVAVKIVALASSTKLGPTCSCLADPST